MAPDEGQRLSQIADNRNPGTPAGLWCLVRMVMVAGAGSALSAERVSFVVSYDL
jgi:hypothetical protein